jgi:hypothetical protein
MSYQEFAYNVLLEAKFKPWNPKEAGIKWDPRDSDLSASHNSIGYMLSKNLRDHPDNWQKEEDEYIRRKKETRKKETQIRRNKHTQARNEAIRKTGGTTSDVVNNRTKRRIIEKHRFNEDERRERKERSRKRIEERNKRARAITPKVERSDLSKRTIGAKSTRYGHVKQKVSDIGGLVRRKGTKIAKGGKIGRFVGKQIERAGTKIAMRPGRTIKGAAIATGLTAGAEGVRRVIRSRREEKL